MSWAASLLFTGAPTPCVALRVRCPGPLGSCSAVCPPGVLRCVCGVLGQLPPVHRCAHSVRCFACVVSWATWLLFTGFPAVCCVACALSWATWLLFTAVPARCVALPVWCPGPLGSCSPVCPRCLLSCVCGVLGHLVLFTGAHTRCIALLVQCPGPLGSCSPVCSPGVLCCVCVVLGHLAPVHRCACLVRCFTCAVSWATWLLFSGAPARCVVLRLRCPGPLGSCSMVHPLGALLCLCGVLGHLAPVHQCSRSVHCFACAVSWATWLLFTGVPAWCVALRVRYPGPLGSGSPVCPLDVLCCVCGIQGHLAAVHQCPRSVLCFARAVSSATWLPFTSVPARCVVLRVRYAGPLGSWSPVSALHPLLCVCGVLGHLAPVHPCARSVCCVAGAVAWATWGLITGVPARCVVFRVRWLGPFGACSPVGPLRPLVCLCGVPGHLVPVNRCARSVFFFWYAVSWATWLLFCGVRAPSFALLVRCPGPLGSCSPVYPLGVLCCVCGVLGRLAPVQRYARSVCCVACAVSWAAWLLFTGVPALCVVLRVRCLAPLPSCSPGFPLGVLCSVYGVTGLLGSCSALCSLGVLCWVCGVMGDFAPVHQCARSVCCAVGCVCGASLRGEHSSITSTDPPRHNVRQRHTAPQRATVKRATARRDATRHRSAQQGMTDPNLKD